MTLYYVSYIIITCSILEPDCAVFADGCNQPTIGREYYGPGLNIVAP
jgi:hypothetical protein